jgi:hypothetical protein
VRHTFEHIVVPEGATIAVESLANSNGKIPEGDGTAFARGRWTTLELNNDESSTAPEDTIDLSVNASADASRVVVGESYVLTFDVGNAIDSAVATQPILTLTRPRSEIGVDSNAPESCSESGNDIICNLSEIPAGGSEQISLTLIALEPSPSALLRVTVSADQTDSDSSNNAITLPLQIDAESIPEEAPEVSTGGGNGDIDISASSTTGDMTADTQSGGGAVSLVSLLFLALFRRPRNTGV